MMVFSMKMAIEIVFIVDFPMKNGGSFYSYVTNYQRVGVCVTWDDENT